MSTNSLADGSEQLVCDGCGRADDGASLGIKPYLVDDPSGGGGKVEHHYCVHCALNRNARLEVLNVPVPPSNLPAPQPAAATPEEALAAVLPAPVDEAIAAADQIAQEQVPAEGQRYD